MKNRVQYLKKIGVWLLFSLVVLWSLGIFAAAEGTIQLSAGETASGTDDTVTVPLVFRKARDRSAITLPFQVMTIRGDSVTTATW